MKLTKLVMPNSWRQGLMNLLDLRSWKEKKWLFGIVTALRRNSRLRLGVCSFLAWFSRLNKKNQTWTEKAEWFQAESYLHSYLESSEKMSVCCHCTQQFGKHCPIAACVPWLDLNHWDLHLLERNLDVPQDGGLGEEGGEIISCKMVWIQVSLWHVWSHWRILKMVVNLTRLSKQSVVC